jgi:hypothetical protein
VLIAVALIASGQWRAMAVAALTAILFHGAATLVFGPGYWPALLDMAGQHAAIMRSDVAGAEFLVSPYSALVALGLPETLALALQWGLAAAALIAVALAWRTEGIGFDHKAALLVTAILIAPPYLWYGETALLAPALMLLIRAGLIRRTLPGAFLAILMALGVTRPCVRRPIRYGPFPTRPSPRGSDTCRRSTSNKAPPAIPPMTCARTCPTRSRPTRSPSWCRTRRACWRA